MNRRTKLKEELNLGFFLDNDKVLKITESGSQSPAGLHIVQLFGQLLKKRKGTSDESSVLYYIIHMLFVTYYGN